MEEKKEKFRIEALLRGIDIDKVGKEEEVLFKDPSSYEKMSEEDKKKKTEEMKGKLFKDPVIGKSIRKVKDNG